MEIVTKLTQLHTTKNTAVALGKFDGIHVGHQKLLKEILERKQAGLLSCVVTFSPSPAEYFGRGDGRELTNLAEKRLAFERMGIDLLVELPMNEETARMEPDIFVKEILYKGLHMTFLAAGTDVSFGAGGQGNAALLEILGEQLHFTVKTIEKVMVDGNVVSSTGVRALLSQGDMEQVTKCLGTPYKLVGEVKQGNHIGRTIGFPTVNLIPNKKLLPPYGVYASRTFVKGQWYDSITNVGKKPTISQESEEGVETYLFDFHQDVYGERIEVEFLQFLRPERRFDSLEALKEQIEKDKRRVAGNSSARTQKRSC